MSFNAFKYVEDLRNSRALNKQTEVQICILHEVIESHPGAQKDIKESEQRLIIKLVSLLVVALTMIVALFKLNLMVQTA